MEESSHDDKVLLLVFCVSLGVLAPKVLLFCLFLRGAKTLVFSRLRMIFLSPQIRYPKSSDDDRLCSVVALLVACLAPAFTQTSLLWFVFSRVLSVSQKNLNSRCTGRKKKKQQKQRKQAEGGAGAETPSVEEAAQDEGNADSTGMCCSWSGVDAAMGLVVKPAVFDDSRAQYSRMWCACVPVYFVFLSLLPPSKTHVPTWFAETRTLLEENRALKDQRMCKVCMDAEANIVFLPCGHLVCCANCAPALRNCAVCRSLIRGTVRTYLS